MYVSIEHLLKDANTPEVFLNLLPQYTFKRAGNGYRAKGHSSFSVFCKNGTWLFSAHNGEYGNGKALNALNLAKEVLGTSDIYEAAKLVCEAANLKLEFYAKGKSEATDNTPPSRKPTPLVVETKVYLPNAGQTPVKNFTFEIAEKGSFTEKTAAKYYTRKTGVTQAQNVVFLQSITHIETGKKTVFNHKKIGIGYLSNGLAANIRSKIIDLDTNKKQMFTIQNCGNYVFGLDSLPTENRKNFTLLLCAGEDDTNAINANLHPFGFAALTFGSESATIPSDFLTYLRTEFKAVFCLLDSDKTGVKMAIRNATANGLPYISIGDHYPKEIKDVCDIYKQFGAKEILKLVKVETKIKAAEKTNFERIGYNLHKILSLDINQYITEKLDYLKHYISNNQKLLLQSTTDTGKTTAIVELSQDDQFYKSLDIDSIIIAVPRLVLAGQLKEKFKEKGITPSVIDGTANSIDIQEAYQNKVVICTYDSVKKLENHLQYSLLVIDELHIVNEDTSFRGDVTAKVFELIPSAKRVLGLTATPNFEMCIGMQLNEKYIPNEVRNALDFTLCRVKITKDQVKQVQVNCYSESRINAVSAYCEGIAQGSDKAAVLLNDVKVLETVSEVINAKHSPERATILSSKKPQYCTENPIYQAITKGEAVPDETKLFLGTNILTAGVSLNFAVQNVAMFGNLDSRTITQFSARPRRVGEVNKTVNVDLFKRIDKNDFETVLNDFEQRNIETEQSTKYEKLTAIESLQNNIQTAVTLCDAANKLPNKSDKVRRKTFDELGFIYFDESKNEFKPNLPRIIYSHNQQIEKRCTLYGKLVKAKQYDNTFEILTPIYCDFAKNEQATDILKEVKEAAKLDKETAFQVFAENKTAAFEIAFKQTFDSDLKEAIKTEIIPHKDLSEKAKELKTLYPNVTNTGELIPIVSRYFDLKAACFGVSEITENKRMKMLVNAQKTSDYELLKNRIISLSELRSLENDTLTNAEKLRALKSKKLIELVGKVKDSYKYRKNKYLTDTDLIKLVSNTLTMKVDKHAAKLRISELFELSTERQNIGEKKKTVYVIGHRLTLSDVIEPDEKQAKTNDNLPQKTGKISVEQKQHKVLKMN